MPIDEDNNIQTALNHILEERHNRAAEMGRNAQALRDAIERLESLENAKQRANVPGADREKMENILFGGEATRQQFRNLTEKLDDCKKVLRKAAESYQTLETQFNRKTVNLAVLGHMGCGKSRFLQSVSGLDNSYIPSGNGPSCTGATCIIENVNSDSTRVLLSFKNREMVTQDIKAEITRFWKKFAPRNGTPVPEFEELDRAKLSAIYAELEAAWQERPVYLRQYGGVKDEDEWEQSKRIYVEKWDEWFPLVRPNGDESEWSRGVEQRYQLKAVAFDGNTWFELPDHNRIRQFAAKFSGAKGDGPALETHSYHVATEVLLIQKRFTGIFAENLRLIDTVGIDDPAGETRIRMKKALDIGVSDGIIYIDKYTDGRSPDLNEYKTLVETLKERQMKNSKAGYSMALMMNVDSDHPFQDAWIANYFDPNVKAWDRVQGLGERADDVHTASAAPLQDDMNKIYRAAPDLFGDEGVQTTIAVNPTTQPMRVIDFLNDFLSKISRYPGDEEHIANAAEESRHAYEMLEELSNGMRTVRDKLFAANMRKNSSAEIVSQYMRPKLSRLESALVSYRDSLRTLEDMPTPLETHVRNIQLLADGESVEGYSIANIVEEFAKQYPADSDLRNLRAMDQLYLHVRQISDVPPLNYREAETQIVYCGNIRQRTGH